MVSRIFRYTSETCKQQQMTHTYRTWSLMAIDSHTWLFSCTRCSHIQVYIVICTAVVTVDLKPTVFRNKKLKVWLSFHTQAAINNLQREKLIGGIYETVDF